MGKLKRAIVKFYKAITGVQFSKGSKAFITLTAIFLPLAILEKYEVWILKFYINPFSEDNYSWFFSTIAQSMAALFGIGGMFAAYILQIVNNRIKENYIDGRRLASGIMTVIDLSDDEFLSKLDEHIKSPEKFQISLGILNRLKKTKDLIEGSETTKDLLIRFVRPVIIFMTSVIILSLIALPFSHYLSKLTCGFLFGIFLLVLTLVTILKMVTFINGAIQG